MFLALQAKLFVTWIWLGHLQLVSSFKTILKTFSPKDHKCISTNAAYATTRHWINHGTTGNNTVDFIAVTALKKNIIHSFIHWLLDVEFSFTIKCWVFSWWLHSRAVINTSAINPLFKFKFFLPIFSTIVLLVRWRLDLYDILVFAM